MGRPRLVSEFASYAIDFGRKQSLLTRLGRNPPDDQALRADVELAKAMGFNGVRKPVRLLPKPAKRPL